MTKFEFVLNKFYEITAWSLFAAVAMTVLNGDYDTVPASLLWQIPVLLIFRSTFFSDLSLGIAA